MFEGNVTEGDAAAHVDTVLKTKMLESPCSASRGYEGTVPETPTLNDELMKAILNAIATHQAMSTQALNSDHIPARILSTLAGPGALWENLRGQT
jgi:type I restriction enzyme, R subunit